MGEFFKCQGEKSFFSHLIDSSAYSALKGQDCARATVQAALFLNNETRETADTTDV